MAAIVWDWPKASQYVINNGQSFARIKSPRGWPERLRTKYGRELRRGCFRNALFLALHSGNTLYYCEGFASIRGSLYPHAWCTLKESNVDDSVWAIDPTWPWKYKGEVLDNCSYEGVCFEPHVAYDFMLYHKHLPGSPSLSVLKYVDYLPSYLNCLNP